MWKAQRNSLSVEQEHRNGDNERDGSSQSGGPAEVNGEVNKKQGDTDRLSFLKWRRLEVVALLKGKPQWG